MTRKKHPVLKGVVIFGFLAVMGFVSNIYFTVKVFSTPDELAMYQVNGADGRNMAIILLPDNEICFAYTDGGLTDIAYCDHVMGNYGNKIVGNLYYIDRGRDSYTTAPDGMRPIYIMGKIDRRLLVGEKSTWDDNFEYTFSISNNQILFYGTLLTRISLSPAEAEEIFNTIIRMEV